MKQFIKSRPFAKQTHTHRTHAYLVRADSNASWVCDIDDANDFLNVLLGWFCVVVAVAAAATETTLTSDDEAIANEQPLYVYTHVVRAQTLSGVKSTPPRLPLLTSEPNK